jgi:predicted lipid-binding transport protein (Tim44 family)
LSGFGLGANQPALEIQPADYEAFERLLGEVQAAWSNEDVAKLHTLATPEMVSYFSKDLEENKARNDVNKVTDVKLLQGDLAEAWREGETDFASVAMRFSLVDKTTERTTGRLVSGSDTPVEATEVWTFARRRGADWELSAIQQTS